MTEPGGASPIPEVDRLVVWLAARHGSPVTLASPATATGEGFDSTIYFVELAGAALPEPWRRPLVLRIKAEPGQLDVARYEAAVQGWLADRGYPVPRMLAVFEPGALCDRPAQVMERAPGRLALEQLRRAPWQAVRITRELASLHVRLHELPTDGFPAGDDLLDRRLRLTRRAAEALDDPALRKALDRVSALAARLRDAPPSVCHGDFHPLNVLVSPLGPTVIDWTDAGVGDRHGDVARTLLLFELSAIAASNRAERAALRAFGPRLGGAFRRAYERTAPLDRDRLGRWTPVHLLHGWSQAVSLHAGLFDDGSPHDDRKDRVPPAMIDELRARFEAALDALDS